MENRIIKNIVLGVSVMIGFMVTERIYDTSIKMIRSEQAKKLIEIEEAPTGDNIES